MRLLSNSPAETVEIGKSIGRLLEKGDVVALVGTLGSGKTVLAQGIAQGLGVAPDEYVSSPSFTIINEYRGRMPIFHVDTYRLRGEPEMVALGYEEYLDPNGVTVIEWADKIRALLPEKHLLVQFEISGPECRTLEVTLAGYWSAAKSADMHDTLRIYQEDS